jgi:hypothetical protein
MYEHLGVSRGYRHPNAEWVSGGVDTLKGGLQTPMNSSAQAQIPL